MRGATAGLLLAVFPGTLLAQSAAAPQPQRPAPAVGAQTSAPAAGSAAGSTTGSISSQASAVAAEAKEPRSRERRRAAKLFLSASKLFQSEQFEEALRDYQQAAELDPSNRNYGLAADVARSHAVTALVQAAAKDRLRGDAAGARAALAHALELDPTSAQIGEHLHELADDALLGQATPLYEQATTTIGAAPELAPSAGVHSFHVRSEQRQLIQQVFRAYGIEPSLDDTVRPTPVRLDVDNASFEVATRALGLVTMSFYVPLDAHRVLVARNTRENRLQYARQELETVYISGLSPTELTEVGTLAKNVFDVQQATVDPSAGTITLRAPQKTLNAFNRTMSQLLDGRSQVLLEVLLIQIAHTSTRNTGVKPPQSMSAYNVYAEEQSLLNANQSLVQEIISNGLASASEPLTIIGILLASGQVSSSLFSNGLALFGGGKTLSGLSPGSLTANLDLNSSDSRELDQMLLHLSDGEAATMRSGTRYPIQTSSFSSLSAGTSGIAGLTSAGTSSALSSLLSSLSSSVPNVPQVEYQDLGLTLKATPKVMRNDDVALNIDMKIDALSGSSINGNPILNNRAYSGVVTLRAGEAVVVASELDKSESRAISGTPGMSEIPGLNNLTGVDKQGSYAMLLIILTPHVIRGTQAAGHSPMMQVERGEAGAH